MLEINNSSINTAVTINITTINTPMKYKFTFIVLLPFILLACDRLEPDEWQKKMHLPPVGFKGDAAQGVVQYNQYCMTCHGIDGKGSPQGPPLVHDIYEPGHHADMAFHFAVRDGVRSHHWSFGDMKPVADVTPEQTGHIIAYIRREQKRAGIR